MAAPSIRRSNMLTSRAGAAFPGIWRYERRSGNTERPEELASTLEFGSFDHQMKEWIVQCNLKMPRGPCRDSSVQSLAYGLARSCPRINLPTLIISGRASAAAPWKSQEWIHRQIKGSQFRSIRRSRGGQHFMFIENPEKFSWMIMKYLG
jgi:pimeloyl-ACP methyl ester carboxylesterase